MPVVNFRSFDDFLPELPLVEQEISIRLHDLVFAVEPLARCKFMYGGPFFLRRSQVCFIWPGSLTWMGGGAMPGRVKFGLVRGHLLERGAGLFHLEGRKKMSQAIFDDPEKLLEDALIEVLSEAFLLDERLFEEKNARKIGLGGAEI